MSPEKKRKVTISIQNVTKNFQKRFKEKTTPIRDISLHACKGEIIALGGRNGCGKTTLFRVLTGVNRPDQGKARIMGCDTR